MEPVNILTARNNLSRLVRAASKGEEIVIANRGKPVARLVAVETDKEHTAERAAAWLALNVMPADAARDDAHLDRQIDVEREGWE